MPWGLWFTREKISEPGENRWSRKWGVECAYAPVRITSPGSSVRYLGKATVFLALKTMSAGVLSWVLGLES